MEKTKLTLSLQCPNHEMVVGMLNVDPNAQKIGYCYECIAENGADGTFLQTLKTVPGYLKDSSSFYEKCRQRVYNTGEPPAEYVEELAKKGERLEKLSKHIDEEKDKMKKSFEEIRKTVIEIIDKKEKECLELLDKEIVGLSEAYSKFERLLMMGWPKPSDIQNIYPDIDTLRQRISKIESIDQLKAFMTGIQEDIQIQSLYFKDEEDGLTRIKRGASQLITCLNMPESSLPKVKSKILNSENIESLMKDLMEKFIHQEAQVENSIVSRIHVPSYESKIISDAQFEILKGWLPQGYKFDLKLLYKGSADGMSSWMFHEKCDNKGATITLIKCRFGGAWESSVIGGFLDKSWNSDQIWGSSKEAFLFLLAGQGNSVKCPVLESQSQYAFYGHSQYGPVFGGGNDLCVQSDCKTGGIHPNSYSNASALRNGNKSNFCIEEIEVFQVQ